MSFFVFKNLFEVDRSNSKSSNETNRSKDISSTIDLLLLDMLSSFISPYFLGQHSGVSSDTTHFTSDWCFDLYES